MSELIRSFFYGKFDDGSLNSSGLNQISWYKKENKNEKMCEKKRKKLKYSFGKFSKYIEEVRNIFKS